MPHGQSRQARRVTRALRIASTSAFFLAVLKGVAGWWTGSLALLASALDSGVDTVISTTNLFGHRMAHKPADSEHAFGHGKLEALLALTQGLVLMGIAIAIGVRAVLMLEGGEIRLEAGEAAVVSLISLLGTLWIVWFLQGALRGAESLILQAETAHYTMDLVNTAAVLIALVLARVTGIAEIDPIISMVVALTIVLSARRILADAIQELMDRALPGEVERVVDERIRAHPETIGYHDLRTRRAGPQKFISLHLEIRADLPFSEAHRITEEVRDEVEGAIPGSHVFIHADPDEWEIAGEVRRGPDVP